MVLFTVVPPFSVDLGDLAPGLLKATDARNLLRYTDNYVPAEPLDRTSQFLRGFVACLPHQPRAAPEIGLTTLRPVFSTVATCG
jgi:hypothetical protein